MRSKVLISAIALAAASGCAVKSQSIHDTNASFSRSSFILRPANDDTTSFATDNTLDPLALVDSVLARNPNVEIARQGWRRAIAQYPQATTFDDTTMGVSIAPLSVLSSDARFGVGLEISQPLPYPGKRRLRGEVAAAEAEAAHAGYLEVRQRLALMAVTLFYDLFLVERALDINAEHVTLLEEYGRTVDLHLQAGRAWQDDALKVDVDLVELRKLRVSLESERRIVRAQINALLHRATDAPLGETPENIALPAAAKQPLSELQALATSSRPELRGVDHERRGAKASVDLAKREYYPDMAVKGSYNRMWAMTAHQFMLGLAVTLPTQRAARRGAEDAARARLHRTDAMRAELADQIRLQVHTALSRLTEARDAWALYAQRALPAATSRVDAIRLGLDAGRTTFIEVIRAERELRAIRLRVFATIAAANQHRAKLDWATGRAPGVSTHDRGAQ